MSDPLEPFATVAELEAFWRPLTGNEPARAESLLKLASNRLRLLAQDLNYDLAFHITDSELYKSNLNFVVLEAVKRAMISPTDQPPVDNYSQTAGPYSENYKYTNPSGDLWFSKKELSSLGLYATQSLYSLSTTREEIYS